MKRSIFYLFVAILFLGLFTEQVLGAETKTKSREPFQIQFLAGRQDSAEYALMHGLSQLINKHSSWLKATVIETPGMADNYQLVAVKKELRPKAIICGVASGAQLLSKTKEQGGHPWGPYTDARFVARINETIHTIISLDRKIKTLSDLKGKGLFEGRKTATRYMDDEAIFKEAGIFDTLKLSYGGLGPAMTALGDGLVTAAVALGIGPVEPKEWDPQAPVKEIMAQKDVSFVSYEKEPFERAIKKHGICVSPVTYPPKVLGPTQTEPVIVKYDPLSLLADKTMDAEVVYELLRVFDTQLKELEDFTITAKWIKREYLGTSGYEAEKDYHPGAVKYFKENKIPIRVNPW
jgi:TRAP transporter TAXI family solute receptor